MELRCNIDQRGRRVRLIAGAIVDSAGTIAIVVGVLAPSLPLIIAGVVAFVTGSFMIFEGVRGWCALRALGIKTPV